MAEMIHITIDGIPVETPKGTTILDATVSASVRVPTLCFLKDINEIGACRMCLVEVEGARGLMASCVTPATEGMIVKTNTPALRKHRKTTLELIIANHRMDCLSCSRSTNCELQSLAQEYGVDMKNEDGLEPDVDDSAIHLIRDNSKCILCRRCVAVCQKQQKVGVISPVSRGYDTHISSAFELPLDQTACIHCGQCVQICPTGALTVRDDTDKVWAALADGTKHVVVAPAPSVRAQLGECFNFPMGTNVEGKLASALRRLGFDAVFDVDTAADVTIMEEGTEFLNRLNGGGPLPLITSCSPGWVKFCEYNYPEFIPNISSCKSPQQMFGALTKTYYAEKIGIDPKDLYVVSIMPCTAKKFEITRADQSASGYPDIDVALTTVELANMIKRAGIVFEELKDEEFDSIFGIASGAAHIFGVTGGVMEAALRTVAEIVTGKPLDSVEFHEVRGTKDIKEAEYELAGIKVRVAVTSGLTNAAKLLDRIKAGEAHYDFIEVMACPGGCVNGGGQPNVQGYIRNTKDVRAIRASALYDEDAAMSLRKSHENPVVKEIYDTYLEKPGSHKAHEILHTKFVKREVY